MRPFSFQASFRGGRWGPKAALEESLQLRGRLLRERQLVHSSHGHDDGSERYEPRRVLTRWQSHARHEEESLKASVPSLFRGHKGHASCESRCSHLISIRTEGIKKGFISLIQPDTRQKGSEPYVPLAFALYGPLKGQDVTKEVLRSHLWPVRELVEELPEKLPKGDYLVAIYTPQKAFSITI